MVPALGGAAVASEEAKAVQGGGGVLTSLGLLTAIISQIQKEGQGAAKAMAAEGEDRAKAVPRVRTQRRPGPRRTFRLNFLLYNLARA